MNGFTPKLGPGSAAHRQEALHRVRDTRAHDGGSFKVRAFILHDSRLLFGRLNHLQTDVLTRQNRTAGIFRDCRPKSFAKAAQIAIRVKQKQKRCKTGKKQTVEDRATSLERVAVCDE